MKNFIRKATKSPGKFYLFVFLLLIVPGLMMYPAAQEGKDVIVGGLLGLIIITNLLTALF